MNGANAEPDVSTTRPPNTTDIRMIGSSQYFLRTLANCQSSARKLMIPENWRSIVLRPSRPRDREPPNSSGCRGGQPRQTPAMPRPDRLDPAPSEKGSASGLEFRRPVDGQERARGNPGFRPQNFVDTRPGPGSERIDGCHHVAK